MKKLMFMAMVAIAAMVDCDKEVGVEDEGTTVSLLSYSDTIWRGRNGSRHFYFSITKTNLL